MAPKKKVRTTQITFTVVGMQYRTTKPLMAELQKSVPFGIGLKREPRNTADPNAIAVVIHDESLPQHPMQLGYLRRQVAAVLAPKLDSESVKVEKAFLIQLDPEAAVGEAEIWLKHKGKLALDKFTEA